MVFLSVKVLWYKTHRTLSVVANFTAATFCQLRATAMRPYRTLVN